MNHLRRVALQRRTELARTPLRRKKAIAAVSAAARTTGKQRKQSAARRYTGPDAETRAQLWIRAMGRCERCGRDLTGGYPFSRHHRRPRGNGGSTVAWINELANLLLICGTATSSGGCHEYIENHRAEAYEAGWLVRMHSAYLPAEVPVLIRPDVAFHPVYLTADGHYADGAP